MLHGMIGLDSYSIKIIEIEYKKYTTPTIQFNPNPTKVVLEPILHCWVDDFARNPR